jgi:P-type conjugative transfer protein TrbJ
MRTRVLLLLGVLLLPRLSLAGGLPVFDAALNTLGVQEQWIQLKELYESVQQTANQIKQLENQAHQITGMYTQIDQGVRNLASLDIHNINDLYGLMHQLESKLAQAEYIGYQAQNAVNQAQTLYPRIYGILTADQQRTLTLHWATMRRNSAQVAISTQAIRDAQMRYQQQWADLILRAQRAEGNVQVQQTAVQAQAVVGHQLLAIEQQLATQARERSELAMEMATRTEIEQHLMDKSLAPLEGTYVPQGRLLPPPRTGRE